MWNKRFQAVLVGIALILPHLNAQDTSSQKPTVNLDFSNDPCGNPMMESQSWQLVAGTVVKVVDGRTVIVAVHESARPVRVRLAGLGLPTVREYSERARERVQDLLLNRRVEVWVNPSRWEKQPKRVTAVVHPVEGTEGDIGLLLLGDGLARFSVPRPYTMSRYSECQYRNAERQSKTHGTGLWSVAKSRTN